MTFLKSHKNTHAFVLILLLSIFVFYGVAEAQYAQCNCQMDPKKPLYCPTVTCVQTTNGFTTVGKCLLGPGPQGCQGQTSSSPGGLDGAAGALGMLKQIADLFKGGGGGGGGGAGDFGGLPSQTGCTNFYQVSQPSSDPCAIYTPTPISDALGGINNVSDSLLDALGGGSGAQNNLNNALNPSVNSNAGASSNGSNAQNPQASVIPVQTPAASNTAQGGRGLTGDVRLGSGGATFFANLREGASEIAGFFGGNAIGTANQTIANRLCTARPWANSTVSNVIPASFFDGMCKWTGNQATITSQNSPAKTEQINTVPPAVRPSATNTQPRVNVIPPEIDIWAEPANVRLGARTYIFWTARGVDSCKERGPNFEHNTLSGGASTVPISDATTFTMECVAPDGTVVTDSVTVQLAL